MQHQEVIIYPFLLTENLSQRPISLPLECSVFLFLLRSISMEIQKYIVLLWNIKQSST